MLVGRALQELSAAAVWVVGLAMLVDTVGEERMGQSMGYVFWATLTGLLSAPVLGGIIYEQGGYYYVFVVAFGIIGFDTFLRLGVIKRGAATTWTCGDPESAESMNGAFASDNNKLLSSKKSQKPSGGSKSSASARSKCTEHPQTETSPLIASASTSKLIVRLPPLVTLLLSPRS